MDGLLPLDGARRVRASRVRRTATALVRPLLVALIVTPWLPVLQQEGVAAQPQPPRTVPSEVSPGAPPSGKSAGKWVLQGRSETPFKVGNCEKPGSTCTSTGTSITMGYPGSPGSDDSCTGSHGWSVPPPEMIPGQTVTFNLNVDCKDRYRQECATGLSYTHSVGREYVGGESIGTAAVYPDGYEGKGPPRPSAAPTWTVIPGEENGSLDLTVWCMSCDAKDVHYGYTYQADNATASPPPPPTAPPTEAPTSAPQLPPIEGKVNVADLSGWAPVSVLPIVEVPVTLLRRGEVLAHTVSQAPDGAFSLGGPPADKADGLVIRVELTHGITNPASLKVLYADEPDPVYLQTEPFTLPKDSSSPYVRDVDFGATSGITSGPAYRDKLVDLAVIYYHTRQAWETAAINEGIKTVPIVVRAFSQHETGLTNDGIDIHESYSSRSEVNRPGNREWHEYGHHAMASLLGEDPGLGDKRHDGYLNCSTNNSYSEGFAELFSMLTAKHMGRSTSPWLYQASGTAYNLEANYMPWSYVPDKGGIYSLEEFAVAGLLWDFVDEANTLDVTQSAGFPPAYQGLVSLPNGNTAATAVAEYHDHVSISEKELLDVMKRKPPDGPQINTLSQLYDMMKSVRIGQQKPHPGSDLTALDELFIAHGFFADTSPQNLSYDRGEKIGTTDHPELSIGGVTVKECVPRYAPVPIANSFIGYQARDARTGAPVDIRQFDVEVRFDPPFDYYSYAFQAQAIEPGRLYFVGPDPRYATTMVITAHGAGYESEKALQITNETYWQEMRKNPARNFMEHTFDVTVAGPGGGSGPPGGSATDGTNAGGAPTGAYAWLLFLLVGVGMGVLLTGRRRSARPMLPEPAATSGGWWASGTAPAGGAACGACGTPNRPVARFCRGCGRPL